MASSGQNPADFIAAVNCLTKESPDVGVTLLPPVVHPGLAGNARFDVKLNLPRPCVAPIVFVGTPILDANNRPVSLRWFATTGN